MTYVADPAAASGAHSSLLQTWPWATNPLDASQLSNRSVVDAWVGASESLYLYFHQVLDDFS